MDNIIYYINPSGGLYIGDMRPGDRAATSEEITAHYGTPEENAAAARRAQVLARLAEIDAASIRPLRAIAQSEAVQGDHDRLAALDAEAAELRAELAGLG